MASIVIREEGAADAEVVRRVNVEAFGQPDEAELVDRLRAACPERLSLVALEGDAVVGHILFTPAKLGAVEGMGLAPMAVLPDHQHRGIGGRLVEAGLAELRRRGCPFIIVLGHPNYYPRFGFEPANAHGIRCKWDVPDDVFMILKLDPSRMEGVTGVAHYREELG